MTEEKTGSKPGRRVVRIFKGLAVGMLVLLVIVNIVHFTWKNSGSGRWEQVIDKDGVKIYTLKSPGSVLKRVRGVTHVKTTLNAAVESMMQTSSKDCQSWFPGCQSVQTVKPWNPQDLTYVQLYRLNPKFPFSGREFLLKGKVTQDPQTKAVLIEFMAMPDELALNSCCFRVAHMHNSWRFTPQANGLVEVENRMNVDLGIPYFLFNRYTPGSLFRLLAPLQKYLDNDRWQHTKYDLIKEKA